MIGFTTIRVSHFMAVLRGEQMKNLCLFIKSGSQQRGYQTTTGFQKCIYHVEGLGLLNLFQDFVLFFLGIKKCVCLI